MLFNQIIGQEHIKNHLLASAKNGRIPHAQLFIGKEGSGTLPVAIAYAQFLLSHFSDNPEASEIKVDKLQHPDLQSYARTRSACPVAAHRRRCAPASLREDFRSVGVI